MCRLYCVPQRRQGIAAVVGVAIAARVSAGEHSRRWGAADGVTSAFDCTPDADTDGGCLSLLTLGLGLRARPGHLSGKGVRELNLALWTR